MSNKQTTAEQIYIKNVCSKRSEIINAMEEYAELKCKELREENKRLMNHVSELSKENEGFREENERLKDILQEMSDGFDKYGHLLNASPTKIKQALKGE